MVTRNQNFDVVLERYREMHFLLVSVSFLKLHAVLGLLNDRTHRRNQSLAKHLSCSVLAFGCYFPYLRFEKILNTSSVPIEKQNSIKRVCVWGGRGVVMVGVLRRSKGSDVSGNLQICFDRYCVKMT